jgi:hypothetical protein
LPTALSYWAVPLRSQGQPGQKRQFGEQKIACESARLADKAGLHRPGASWTRTGAYIFCAHSDSFMCTVPIARRPGALGGTFRGPVNWSMDRLIFVDGLFFTRPNLADLNQCYERPDRKSKTSLAQTPAESPSGKSHHAAPHRSRFARQPANTACSPSWRLNSKAWKKHLRQSRTRFSCRSVLLKACAD